MSTVTLVKLYLDQGCVADAEALLLQLREARGAEFEQDYAKFTQRIAALKRKAVLEKRLKFLKKVLKSFRSYGQIH
ncbi:MAG: hypothetical protein FJ088_05410 [Deltaproteobacteria bacterium]|nr:hypothetical protein [Deltaproteobacteria bacterium]